MSYLRVGTNSEALFAKATIQRMERAMNTSMARIATGKRISSAGDDPSSIHLYLKQKATLSGLKQGITNTQEGAVMLNTVSTYMNNVMDSLVAARDLSIRASSSSVTGNTLTVLDSEYQKIRQNIGSLKNFQFNGTNLFNPTTTPCLPGATGLDFICGTGITDKIHISMANTIATASGAATMLASAALSADINTNAHARTSITNLDNVIKNWSAEIARLGSHMQLIENRLDELQAREVNSSQVVSMIGDADMAAEITDLTRMQVVANAATSMLAQANTQPLSVIQALLG